MCAFGFRRVPASEAAPVSWRTTAAAPPSQPAAVRPSDAGLPPEERAERARAEVERRLAEMQRMAHGSAELVSWVDMEDGVDDEAFYARDPFASRDRMLRLKKAEMAALRATALAAQGGMAAAAEQHDTAIKEADCTLGNGKCDAPAPAVVSNLADPHEQAARVDSQEQVVMDGAADDKTSTSDAIPSQDESVGDGSLQRAGPTETDSQSKATAAYGQAITNTGANDMAQNSRDSTTGAPISTTCSINEQMTEQVKTTEAKVSAGKILNEDKLICSKDAHKSQDSLARRGEEVPANVAANADKSHSSKGHGPTDNTVLTDKRAIDRSATRSNAKPHIPAASHPPRSQRMPESHQQVSNPLPAAASNERSQENRPQKLSASQKRRRRRSHSSRAGTQSPKDAPETTPNAPAAPANPPPPAESEKVPVVMRLRETPDAPLRLITVYISKHLLSPQDLACP